MSSYFCSVKKVWYISLLLLLLFMGKMVGDAVLTHTHIYEWGAVTHSHPYSHKGHNHSTNDLVVIAIANHATFTSTDYTHLTAPEQSEISILWSYAESRSTTYLSAQNQRAPPVLA